MYIIIESQTNEAGEVATLVHKAVDRPHAESVFYQVLASAAISSVPIHAAALLTNDMRLIQRNAFFHEGGGENVGNG